MATKEWPVYEEDFAYDADIEDFEYDDNLWVSELLLDNLDHKQLLSFPDEERKYMEMLENTTELEREEHAREDIIKFLTEFPAQREEIERCIQCLHKMADSIDETHKKCTIASIAANSTSASSGILTILGLTLAPFTAGGSLVLTATGIGLGTVAGAAALSATIYESVNNSKEQKKAQELTNNCRRSLRMEMSPDETDFSFESPPNENDVGEGIKNLISTVAIQAPRVYKNVKGIKTNVQALKYARANPAMKALAKRAAAAGSTSQGTIRGIQKVRKAFAGTTLAMSKGARLLGAASAGVFLLFDAYSIAQDAKHLTEGAEAETATEIRAKASKLEEQLWNLNRLYEELKGTV
ncbi:apolipoprotein L2-like [Hemicordylus capensis]|uniref:apolipoprotein L2-like n=1 Tax=Hemicordylus capensis TaxID=884348 RepID=UPI002302CAD2|nr:apolipoprotein L2-like [Hemicordylus capensis]XP_053112071.1 apolipoprotein L2-like [Hemicordylus capensis]XP_053112072.1 apolipoprotein L2-like [Hemicordylus capensis]XP_053112073.1 apolipoprotein L2-like [Hemicordylus capensis]XP_053112074.1 apolipoprotein L2-like [Hemicordylus capensis]XP_053112075.1 apolipoprotein L2-like [Hemicordylus capensis]XP_053112077.1 apolipoprotein L2-like [Hemicordylus capensis]XP_053112078.1 apolipoprotein L2-like [Hemicordylus capensis]XP_053112079.1 apol